jgi:hypothetical protein
MRGTMSRDEKHKKQRQRLLPPSTLVPASHITLARICLGILMAGATLTLAVILTGAPHERPLWLILLVAAVVLCCLLLAYALGKAVSHPVFAAPQVREPQSPRLPV